MNIQKVYLLLAASIAVVFSASTAFAADISVTSCAELQAMRDNLTASYSLGNDINCAGFDPDNDGRGFIPVGLSTAPFSGSFNGNGHTISNLTIARPSEEHVSLFGYVDGGGLTTTFNNVTITGSVEGLNFTAALVGSYTNGTLVIENVRSSASVLGHGSTAGGILGIAEAKATITNSHATGNVTITGTAEVSQVGGIAGLMFIDGVIFGSSASGVVSVTTSSSAAQIGGLVGLFYGDTIGNSSASGTVNVAVGSVANTIGGLAGGVETEGSRITITGSHATGSVIVRGISSSFGVSSFVGAAGDPMDITLSYATGDIDVDVSTYLDYGVGGLVGSYLGGVIHRSYSTGNIAVHVGGLMQHGVGGLIGFIAGATSITDSFAERDISVVADTSYASGVGGLIGWDEDYAVLVDRVYAIGNLYARSATVTSAVGGLVGHIGNSGTNLANSFFFGSVVAITTTNDSENLVAIGGLIGERNNDPGIVNVFWDKPKAGQARCSGFDEFDFSGCVAVLDGSAYFKDTNVRRVFSTWNFNDVWTVVAGNYPNLLELPAANFPVAIARRPVFVASVPVAATAAPVSSRVTVVAAAPFARDLTIGSKGADVRALQQFLNSRGFTVSKTGPGSAGNETDLFGSLTKIALAKFQAAQGIRPAAGFFGPRTRTAVLALIK